MENENKTIVEINGIKMEVDLRYAKTIDHYKVGDKVKVLVKEYSETYKSHAGIIIGFEDFNKKPSIVICMLEVAYDKTNIVFKYFNEGCDFEITMAEKFDVPFEKESVLQKIDNELAKKQREVEEIEHKKKYFLDNFNKYFDELMSSEAVNS